MTIKTTIDVEMQLITHEISDQLTIEEILCAFKDLYAHPDFNSGYAILVKLQAGSTSALTADDMHEMVKITRQFSASRGAGKSAVVALSAEDYGMSHVAEFLLKDETRKVKVFNNLDDARAWLAE